MSTWCGYWPVNRLALDDTLDDLDEVDREVRRRVLGYSRWYDPADKAKILEKLVPTGKAFVAAAKAVLQLKAEGCPVML